jgi:hypothetical protein
LSLSGRLGALFVLSLTVTLITLTIATQPTYAATTITLTLNPPNPTANNIVQFQGAITPSYGISQEVALNLYRDSGCSISKLLFNIEGASDSTGSSYSIDVRLGIAYLSYIGPGNYSAFSYLSSTPSIASSCVNFTVSEPVPEFPVGTPISVILVLVACALVIGRGTVKKRTQVGRIQLPNADEFD